MAMIFTNTVFPKYLPKHQCYFLLNYHR